MSELSEILESAGVRSVLIVDDAYDEVPLPSDLSIEDDEWTQFFDDLTEEDESIIRAIYPGYDDVRADDLRASDEFVAALWGHRKDIREELISPLFVRYDLGAAADLRYLATLEDRLLALGLKCAKAGRSFHGKASEANLIVIDLFLGSAQGESDSAIAIRGLKRVVADRQGRPPLVILMSRNPRIDDKREEFRDSVGLFESAFRIIRKSELSDSGKLERLLVRLASHYADSLKLARFLCAWSDGLEKARQRTSRLIRTLDLADYAQMHQLLLSAEGQPAGSYLVDVFDQVLHHEVESEASIIDAAIGLNQLTSENYPPPYVAGSRDLQDLVYRSLFQSRERLRLGAAEGSCVAFGDLLRRKEGEGRSGSVRAPEAHSSLGDILEAEVLAVLSPACDLQRDSAKRILFLVGELRPLQSAAWTYGEDARTPVIQLVNGQRWWIKWNLKHVITLSPAEIVSMLEGGEFEIIARMRESHALELQQKLLSSLGRVGQIARMPATFPMRVEVYLRDKGDRAVPLHVPVLVQEGGVCYVGRTDKGKPLERLVLSEGACEGICTAIESLDPSQFHNKTQDTLTYLRNSGELLAQVLEHGVWLPNSNGKTELRRELSRDAATRTIGFVFRNREVVPTEMNTGVVLATWEEAVEQSHRQGA